jgi:ribulose-phosphate 3-epimerase
MVESVRKNHPGRFLDTHLMIEDPDRWAPAYADAGSEIVTFQAEASLAPTRLARELRSRGAKAGMALRPQTAIEPFEDILGELDLILVMTVDPGFGGQPFLESMLPKIERTRKLIDKHGLDIWLQVDGGVTDETIGRCVDAGADVFVAGSVVFRAEEPDSVVRSLRQRAEQR